MDTSSSQAEFGSVRKLLWPIHRHELPKLIPMLLMFFLISFNYNVLRTIKDTVVVTAKSSGPEVIPFIKVWVMLPLSIILTIAFTWLSNRFSQTTVFYSILGAFLGFFAVFTFLIYPLGDRVHLHDTADYLAEVLPLGMSGFVAMVRYWSYTLFYAMSELWGNIVLFVLFWGFANNITKITEAKRFYGLFGIGANASGVFAGQISIAVCRYYGPEQWLSTFSLLTAMILVSGVIVMLLFGYINKIIDTQSIASSGESQATAKKAKPKVKFSFRENVAYLVQSSYLRKIAVIVLAYNLVINLVEVMWKHDVKMLYPSPSDYNLYMNKITSLIGVIATLSALFVSGNSLRIMGWRFTAMITPVILFVTSIGFMASFLLKDMLPRYVFLGFSLLELSVFFGSLQNCLSRGCKYTVYDATKEIAFVPLSAEARIKGKSIIDGVCTRLGKGSGSFIYQGLLVFCATISQCAPFIAIILFGMIGSWGMSVYSLGADFKRLTSEETDLDTAQKDTPAPTTVPSRPTEA